MASTPSKTAAGTGGKIEMYVDIASFFSYIAVLQIIEQQDVLEQHGVQIEIYPMLIGGAMAGSKNQPPWIVPAKRQYLAYDTVRAKRLVNLGPETQAPADLMTAARTQSAMRALSYIRDSYPTPIYHAALVGMFQKFWTKTKLPPYAGQSSKEERAKADQAARDLTTPENVAAALRDMVSAGIIGKKDEAAPGDKLFKKEEVEEIMKHGESEKYKTLLKQRVGEALKLGAFGAPWIWVTPPSTTGEVEGKAGKGKKKGEPVFGSDRWNVIYDILGLPYTRLALQPPAASTQDTAKL